MSYGKRTVFSSGLPPGYPQHNLDQLKEMELAEDIKLRITAMQFIANISLFIMFCLNWYLNPDAFEVQSRSDVMRDLNVVTIAVIGTLIGIVVCALPSLVRKIEKNWEDYIPMPYTRTRGVVLLAFILFLLALWAGIENTVLFTLESFLVFFFCSALIFGMYGIWHQKGPHLVTAAMFTFATAIGTRNPMEQLPEILAFSIFFLCFIELGESSSRYHMLMKERLVPIKHQAKMVEKYFEHLLIFVLLALALTYVSLYGRQMADVFSSGVAAEALELHTLYGAVTPAVFIIGAIIVFRALWNQGYIKKWYTWLQALPDKVAVARGHDRKAVAAAAAVRGRKPRRGKKRKRR